MKEIEAIYEGGILRPVEPLVLPEGTRLELILVNRDKPSKNGGNASTILAELAALPLEGSADPFSGRDHDSVLYSENRTS